MFHVVLYQPEIPPNTGNIIRLCANTGSTLHLVHPLGFELDDRRLRRAGLDYREFASVQEYPSLELFREQVQPARLWGVSTKGAVGYSGIRYQANDAFLFGPVLATLGAGHLLRIPMLPACRSLNLSNAVAVMVYEAWRQLGFSGSAGSL